MAHRLPHRPHHLATTAPTTHRTHNHPPDAPPEHHELTSNTVQSPEALCKHCYSHMLLLLGIATGCNHTEGYTLETIPSQARSCCPQLWLSAAECLLAGMSVQRSLRCREQARLLCHAFSTRCWARHCLPAAQSARAAHVGAARSGAALKALCACSAMSTARASPAARGSMAGSTAVATLSAPLLRCCTRSGAA